MCVYCFAISFACSVCDVPRAQNFPGFTMHRSSGRCKMSTKNEYSESQQFPKSVGRMCAYQETK